MTFAAEARRRRFTRAEKLSIVAEAERSTRGVSAVARRHGIDPSVLFRWRKQLGRAPQARLVGVVLSDGALADLLPDLGSRAAP